MFFIQFQRRKSIYKELQERAKQEADACFLLHTEAKFDEDVIKTLDATLAQCLKNPKDIKRMNMEEKLSMVIVRFTEDYLEEKDRMFLF